jgi:hypothetical protein
MMEGCIVDFADCTVVFAEEGSVDFEHEEVVVVAVVLAEILWQ